VRYTISANAYLIYCIFCMSTLRNRVEEVLEDHVRPILAMHRGSIAIVDVDDEHGVVQLKFTGSCHGCPITSITFYNIVEKSLMEELPEVNEVIDIDNPPEL